jgi:hypothetical protein
MSARQKDTEKRSNQPAGKQPKSAHAPDQKDDAHGSARKNKEGRPDRTGGQNRAVDQKRNDEEQYHADGVAHDPHNRTQERIDSGDPDAGDLEKETRAEDAPFNKTYGHHE